MVPFTEIVPVIIKPVEVAGEDILLFQFCYDSPCDFFGRQEPAQERMAVACRVGDAPECDFRDGGKDRLQAGMVIFLDGEELAKLAKLCQTNRRMKFGDTIVIPDKRVKVCAAVDALMIMSMIGESIGFLIDCLIICDDSTPFGAGNGLYKVKGEGAGMADRAQV